MKQEMLLEFLHLYAMDVTSSKCITIISVSGKGIRMFCKGQH
jgi:hypothetical protein